MLLVIEKGVKFVGTVGVIIMGVHLVPLIGSIFPTEIALRKNLNSS